jgi:hypothetical protein
MDGGHEAGTQGSLLRAVPGAVQIILGGLMTACGGTAVKIFWLWVWNFPLRSTVAHVALRGATRVRKRHAVCRDSWLGRCDRFRGPDRSRVANIRRGGAISRHSPDHRARVNFHGTEGLGRHFRCEQDRA